MLWLAAGLALTNVAEAQDRAVLGDDVIIRERPLSTFSALLGGSSTLDQDPLTMRVSVRGELGLAERGLFSGSVLLPITLTTQGAEGFGISPSHTLIEVPLSVRGRLFPDAPFRPYADAGVGLAFGTAPFDGWFVDESSASLAVMTRTALGVEVGAPNRWAVAIEPVSWSTYFASGELRAKYGLMAGVSFPL